MYKIFAGVILLYQFTLAQVTEDILQCAHVEEAVMMKTLTVPRDGLYILHNLAKGKEERIFICENARQVYW